MLRASALQTYASLSPAAQKRLLMEVATAGQKGLKINDPAARLQLRHLPNLEPISALQGACLLFVGVQLLLPGEEAGFDFQREFEMARGGSGGIVIRIATLLEKDLQGSVGVGTSPLLDNRAAHRLNTPILIQIKRVDLCTSRIVEANIIVAPA